MKVHVHPVDFTVDQKLVDFIQKKLDIVRSYMKTEWNVDIDELRDEILRRENNIINGSVSLTDLSIN